MVEFISIESEFLEIKRRFGELFRNVDFKLNPFRHNFNIFLGIEFYFIFNDDFIYGMRSYQDKHGVANGIENALFFYTIKPSAAEYFFRRYEKYSAIKINRAASIFDINDIITRSPVVGSGDSICISAEEVSWFSPDDDWAILGSREWEIAVAGFTSERVKRDFLSCFSDDAQTMFTTLQIQANALDEMLVFSEEMRIDYQLLVSKYQDKIF